MRQFLSRLAVAALLVPATAGALTVIASPAGAVTGDASEQALETAVNRLVDVERGRAGCAPLKTSEQLITAARAHSAWMAQTGKFSHLGSGGSTFVTRVEATGYRQPSGENIAWGYRSASAVVDGWMNSPGHRANILNCRSKAVGVGVAHDADGTPYYTQDFGY